MNFNFINDCHIFDSVIISVKFIEPLYRYGPHYNVDKLCFIIY